MSRPRTVNQLLRGVDDDIKKLALAAHAQGYVVGRTSKGHVKVSTPPGQPVRTIFAPGTPSDPMSFHRVRIKLRRIGVEL